MITLKKISVYPIKSIQGLALSQCKINPQGLVNDRQFVITDPQGKFITGRTKAKLVLVTCNLDDQKLQLRAPGMPDIGISTDTFSSEYTAVQVWQDTIMAQHCHKELDHWFTQYLGVDCQLHVYGQQSQRVVKDTDVPLAFADGYPIMGISTASLDDLNSKLATSINMAQFRPNLVFSSTKAFIEDSWKKIKIGEIEFMVSKPCSRCIFTTVNEQTGERSPEKEPMRTLSQYRKHTDGEVYFGQNLIPLGSGTLHVGDKVEVLETQPPIINQ